MHQVLSHWGCDWIQALFGVKKNILLISHENLHNYLHCITVQYIASLQNSKVQYITLHYSTLHYITAHYSTLILHACTGLGAQNRMSLEGHKS